MNIKEPILIRASSLAGLFECPARWEAQNIRGLRTPSSGSARLGTAVHTSTALFDTSRMNGTGITPDEAAGAAVDAIHKPDEEVLWDDLQPTEAERIALSLHRLYCSTIAPRQTYAAVEATCERLDIAEGGRRTVMGLPTSKPGNPPSARTEPARHRDMPPNSPSTNYWPSTARTFASKPRPRSSGCKSPKRKEANAWPQGQSPAGGTSSSATKNFPVFSKWPQPSFIAATFTAIPAPTGAGKNTAPSSTPANGDDNP